MKWMAITQCVSVNAHQERHDSVAQRWSSIALVLGYMPIHLPTLDPAHASSLLEKLSPGALVLTGGNSLEDEPTRDQFELALLGAALKMNIPVLGVCRGMQLINKYYGGTLSAVHEHVGKRHGLSFSDTTFPAREVNSYHQFGVLKEHLGKSLVPIALAEDGTVEALKHPTHRVTGIMWHPEREPAFIEEDKHFLMDALR